MLAAESALRRTNAVATSGIIHGLLLMFAVGVIDSSDSTRPLVGLYCKNQQSLKRQISATFTNCRGGKTLQHSENPSSPLCHGKSTLQLLSQFEDRGKIQNRFKQEEECPRHQNMIHQGKLRELV